MKQLLTLLKKIKKDANTAIKMLKDNVSDTVDIASTLTTEASEPIVEETVEDLSVETPETLEDFKNEEITNN